MRNLYMLFFILTIIGGINWGLIGLFNFDLLVTIFGTTVITKIMHVLIGVSAGYLLFHTMHHKDKLTTM